VIVKPGVEFSVTSVITWKFLQPSIRSNPFPLDLPKQSSDTLLSPNPICVLLMAQLVRLSSESQISPSGQIRI
jgi:hypothetical protein